MNAALSTLQHSRMVAAMTAMVDRLRLDLSELRVVTEAATACYAVTAVMAAMAGATVTALAKNSIHGSASEAANQTMELANRMQVGDRIRIVDSLRDCDVAEADIITSSGHLRPIDRHVIDRMKPTAVIPLMHEAWELRSGDVDLEACRRRGIRVAGTNERHPDVGVFDYLGPVVVKAALVAGHELVHERCLLISDNDFGAYVERSLRANGAEVCSVRNLRETAPAEWDIVVIATTPPQSGGTLVRLEGVEAVLYCQLWGDVDRTTTSGRWLPEGQPPPGHMGLTLQSLGPVPIVRLQVAGLKVGQVLSQQSREPTILSAYEWVSLVDSLV